MKLTYKVICTHIRFLSNPDDTLNQVKFSVYFPLFELPVNYQFIIWTKFEGSKYFLIGKVSPHKYWKINIDPSLGLEHLLSSLVLESRIYDNIEVELLASLIIMFIWRTHNLNRKTIDLSWAIILEKRDSKLLEASSHQFKHFPWDNNLYTLWMQFLLLFSLHFLGFYLFLIFVRFSRILFNAVYSSICFSTDTYWRDKTNFYYLH